MVASITIVTAAIVVQAMLAPAVGAEPAKRPNVLFIMADDLNNSLGCYGHAIAKSPNIDRRAQRGVRFDRAYCQFPLCGPSRNSMLTGLYPNSTGIIRNAQLFRQTIPSREPAQAFRQQGYFAARIGKISLQRAQFIGTTANDDPGSWELELNPVRLRPAAGGARHLLPQARQLRRDLSWYARPAATSSTPTACRRPTPSGF